MRLLTCCVVALVLAAQLRAVEPVAPPAERGSAAADDLQVIRERLVLSVLPQGSGAIAKLHAEAGKDAKGMRADGSWDDVHYDDTSRSTWAAAVHLDRTLVMAKSARVKRNSGAPDAELEGKVIAGLEWWTSHDYKNSNWWWNEIGVPVLMGEIANVMGEQLPGEELAKVLAIMARTDWHKWTGANLTWGVGVQIARGVLRQSVPEVSEGYERLYEEIRVMAQPQDGLQQDGSFHQHGVQLYNGGYGLDYANDVGRLVSFSWGTRFEIPAEKMALFSSFLLDGQQWMIRGTTFDYSAVGREITRPGKTAVPADKTAGPNVVALLAAEPTPRQSELATFAKRLEGDKRVAELSGNKEFWCSDFMTHRRADYYASVRMLSNRTLNSEVVNSEGRKSVHMTDGVNLLYLTGDEYRNIFPVWDWTKLPGTTAIQGTLETGEPNPINLRGTTTFDGGVSDGMYGLAAQDLSRGKLRAKKAWFFFDSGYVALGAGITLEGDQEHEVATDVNQPLLMGDVLTSEAHAPIVGEQRYHSAKPVWIYHDRVGYIVGAGEDVSVSAGKQTGSWADIGTGPSDVLEVPVFNLWINHGKAPAGSSYEYTVLPKITPEQLAERTKRPEFEVVANTEAVQAVYDKTVKLAEIVFREAGVLATPVGRVEADHSCLLLVQETAAGVRMTASNPENLPLTLHVKVNGRPYEAVLPGGNFAGSSVRATALSTSGR